MKITFLGAQTYDSLLSQIVRETGVNFAILQGTISTIKDMPYGQLLVSFEGDVSNIHRTITLLKERNLDVEVMN
ncbi:Methionine import ATP-binding protein MetN [compost metagenome]